MNINNFEGKINKTILDRGYSYYIDGNVVEAYEQGENNYFFRIEGSDHYEVVVETGENGDILYSECDCPFDFGPVCKHEVAAYFQLFEMLNQESVNDQVKNNSHKQSTLKEVLNNLSKEELINIILNFTDKDATLENSLLVKYSNGDSHGDLKACKKLINSIVKKYTGREGFIKYRDTSDFVSELEEVVEKARNTENVFLAFDIAVLLLEEAIAAFQYADDSNGDIGPLVSDTLEVIGEIAIKSKKTGNNREKLFEKLFAQIDNEIFEEWEDYKINLLNICFEFAEDELLRNQLRMKIESMVDKETSNSYRRYWNESMFHLLLRLIEEYGTKEEAEQFIYDHLQYSSFRKKLLKKNIQQKNYYKVIELAKEGEKKDQQYPGLISEWKKFRYAAYKSLLLKEEQQRLAKELFLTGEFEYYQDLKELTSESHEIFYTNLKQEIKIQNGRHNSHLLLQLIEEENDQEELLEFVRNDPGYVENYAEKLLQPYKEEVITIYGEFIKTIASTSSNRREYQEVCYKITRFKKIAGKTKQMELIDELMGLYGRRPAFIDELEKIK
jgi:uncharacterized Zn finger protein